MVQVALGRGVARLHLPPLALTLPHLVLNAGGGGEGISVLLAGPLRMEQNAKGTEASHRVAALHSGAFVTVGREDGCLRLNQVGGACE